MKNVTESLAGRAIYFEMLPVTYGEEENAEHKNFFDLWEKDFSIKEIELREVSPFPYILRGFMPPLIHIKKAWDSFLWWKGYTKTYIERDLRELSQIESIIDFKKVIDSLALRTGNLLNQIEVARDTGVSQPTVCRYIKLLEVSNLVKRIYSCHTSRKKRLLKSPKLFFVVESTSSDFKKWSHPEEIFNFEIETYPSNPSITTLELDDGNLLLASGPFIYLYKDSKWQKILILRTFQ